jgi:hypothetical protein
MDDRERDRIIFEHRRKMALKPDWRLYMRPDVHLWVRPDAQNFMPSGVPHPAFEAAAERKYTHDYPCLPAANVIEPSSDGLTAQERREIEVLRLELALLKLELLPRKALHPSHYDPNQPRVPAGVREGGQWTHLAANEMRRPPLSAAAIVAEMARRVIEAYRSENGLSDLFGRKEGTVTVTIMNGTNVFGSNSSSPTYTARDRAAAASMRDTLIEKYPSVMQADHVGQIPNDGLFHAETTVLLRAARENGGSLEGQSMEVHTDRQVCYSCKTVLPYVGLQLGNPTVTFIEPSGLRRTMQDGAWIK